MRLFLNRVWLCFFGVCLMSMWGFAAEINPAAAFQQRMCEVFGQRKSAVVKIFSVTAIPDGSGRKTLSVGTAFFIDKKGRLLANANVVTGNQRMWIEHEGTPYPARCLGMDPATNLALIEVEQTPRDFSFVDIAKSSFSPQAASLLLAVSCKLGFDPGPSMGMLVGKNSNYGNQLLPTSYLRTDIPSDGAEGGAPVFDLEGRFVGMVVVSLPEIRASFLLPARAVQYVSETLARDGRMEYAYLGLNARQRVDLNGDLQVCLDDVVADGPAAVAGLEKGDVLLQVGAHPIRRDDDLREAVFFARPEKAVLMKVMREGKERTFSVRVAVRQLSDADVEQTAAVQP